MSIKFIKLTIVSFEYKSSRGVSHRSNGRERTVQDAEVGF